MASSATLLLCGVGLICYATAVLGHAIPHLSKEQAEHAEPVHTYCSTYKNIAAATPTGPPAPSNTTYRHIINPNSPSRVALMETPSNTIWIPKCQANSYGGEEYARTQHRQLNNQPFCVFGRTGEILFDPFRTERGRSASTPLSCDCFHWAAAIDFASSDPHMSRPECDPHTGDFKGERPAYFT